MLFVTSFQAIDLFHCTNYIRLTLKGFWQPRSGKMPDKCLVFGCNNRPSRTERISLHPISFEGADKPEKRKWQKKWVDFVKFKRAHWEPTKYSAVCSKHWVLKLLFKFFLCFYFFFILSQPFLICHRLIRISISWFIIWGFVFARVWWTLDF